MTQKKAIKHIRWYVRQVKQNPPNSNARTQQRRQRLFQYKEGLNSRLESNRIIHSV